MYMYQKTEKALQQLGYGITHQARIIRAIQGSISRRKHAGRLEGASRLIVCNHQIVV
jgi:hypothetical protein